MERKPSLSIRHSLLISLLFVFTVLIGAIIATYTYGIRKSVVTLSRTIINQAIEQTRSELDGYFAPVYRNLLVTREWGRKGLLDVTRTKDMVALFRPIVERYPQINSFRMAAPDGREFLLVQREGRLYSRETRIGEWGVDSRLSEWGVNNTPIRKEWQSLNYNPLSRPWYKGAVRLQNLSELDILETPTTRIYWTKPYDFWMTDVPGMTASLQFQKPDGTLWVIAFDVLIKDITEFTMNLQISDNSQVIVTSDDDYRVIGLPRNHRFDSPEKRAGYLLKRMDQLDLPILADAITAYRKVDIGEKGTYQFEGRGERWWTGLGTFWLSVERKLHIAVFVPEFDLLGELSKLRWWIILILAGVLFLAIGMAIVLAGRYSRPVEALVADSRRISTGDLEAGEPIQSEIQEFQRLARAHDQMRQGLRTLLKLERDIQLARQIQLDTFPRQLPGLPGYAIAAFNEPAEGAAGDTYDVIGLRVHPHDSSVTISEEQSDQAVFFLADAAGHGIGPAISVMQLRAMLRMAVRMPPDPHLIVKHINAQLCADLKEGRFITAWLGHLDTATHRLKSFSAGQAPLLHFHAKDGSCSVLKSNMLPFGIMENIEPKIPAPIDLHPGDLYAVFSDGFFEAANNDGRLFGKERLIDTIKQYYDTEPQNIIDEILKALDRFTASAPPDDDRTAILIRRER